MRKVKSGTFHADLATRSLRENSVLSALVSQAVICDGISRQNLSQLIIPIELCMSSKLFCKVSNK